MDRSEFSVVRRLLGKTQREMAEQLGTSVRAIQSFEQGWRRIPFHVERQTLYILAMKRLPDVHCKPCWETQKCKAEWRQKCPAYKSGNGHLCWFINGRICKGKTCKNWERKMQICRQCEVFRSIFPFLPQSPLWS